MNTVVLTVLYVLFCCLLRQAFHRALQVRRQMTTQVRVVYENIMVANAHARSNPEMKLSTRTQAALLTLQKGKMISHVLKACQTLEYSTSYSVVCCSNFVIASASKILFTLIRSCNRSTPHQELLRYVSMGVRVYSCWSGCWSGCWRSSSMARIYLNMQSFSFCQNSTHL